MTIKQMAEKTLKEPLEMGTDDRPAMQCILDGLARKASTGNPAAARELREWLTLQDEN